jgi:hypothetical protein
MKHIEYKVKVYADGSKWWYLNGKHHREDGPAIEHTNGSKKWFLNGKYHREDGPAIEYTNGAKYWFLNGKCHREDGPAWEHTNGAKYWFLNGKQLTEAEFNKKMKKPCENKVVEIDGVKYKLAVLED